MSDTSAGGPPRDENDPSVPQEPGAADLPGAAQPEPTAQPEPAAPLDPYTTAGAPPAEPTSSAPGEPTPSAAPAEPPVSPYGGPDPAPSPGSEPPAQPYGSPPAGQPSYGQGPPPGQPYGQQPAPGQPYGQPGYPPPGQPYGQPGYPPPGQPYGQPGYPPPGTPYGQVGQPVQIGEAFTYGWNKFTQNAGVIIGGVLTYVAALAVLSIVFYALLIGTAATSIDPVTNEISTSGGLVFGFGLFAFIAVMAVLGFLVQGVVVNVSLLVTRGKKLEYADFFRLPNVGNVILTALLMGLAIGILSITIVGGIVFAFFALFTIFYVIDKNLGVFDAFKASFTVVSRNLATVLLLFLAVYAAQIVGSLLCYVGLLVALPVAQIATAYVYRRLNQEQPV
jgi:uncharacterized membrane protein